MPDKWNLKCDFCGRWESSPKRPDESFVEGKKRMGFRSKKVEGEWENWCSKCLRHDKRSRQLINKPSGRLYNP